jgi:hypothetical protein
MAEKLLGVVHDRELARQLEEIKAHLGGGSFVHLFTNDIEPDPSLTVGDFTEAAYDNYDVQDVTNEWGDVEMVAPGVWEISTPTLEFADPATGEVTLYGCYLTDNDGLLESFRFPEPVTLQPGLPLRLAIVYRAFDAATLVEMQLE